MKDISSYTPIIASSLLHIAKNCRSIDLKNYALTHFSVSVHITYRATMTMVTLHETKFHQGSIIPPSEKSSSIRSFTISEQNIMMALYNNVRVGYATQITVSARCNTKSICRN